MRKRYYRPIQLVQKMTFLVLLLLVPETRNKCSRYRSYTSRTRNNATTKFKSHSLLSYLSRASSTFSFVVSSKRIPTSGSFTTGTSSMLSYSISSKIHPFHFLHLQKHKGPLVVAWQQFEVVLLFQQRSPPQAMCRCSKFSVT